MKKQNNNIEGDSNGLFDILEIVTEKKSFGEMLEDFGEIVGNVVKAIFEKLRKK